MCAVCPAHGGTLSGVAVPQVEEHSFGGWGEWDHKVPHCA